MTTQAFLRFLRFFWPRRAALVTLIFGGAVNAAAQGADTSKFPPVPSSTPVAHKVSDPNDSGFTVWRRAQLPRHDNTPAAWTLRAGTWDLLVATPRALDAMDTSRIIDTTLATCREPLHLTDDDSARVAQARPWAAFDSLAADQPVFVISVMPVLHNFTECGWKNHGRPAMIRRGLRTVTEYTYDPARDPTSAVLLSRLRIVTPVMLARTPVVVLTRGGAPPGQPTDQLRLYIPFDAIAPLATGDMPQTELLLWHKGSDEPAHIILPADILHIIWWDYLRWRAARLAVRDRATSAETGAARRAMLALPAPSDTGLRTALRRQRAGHDADAAGIALERLADAHLSTNDRRIGLMTLASTFQADDDAPAAALAAGELTAMDPCAFAGGAAGEPTAGDRPGGSGTRTVGTLLDHTRADVRCTAMAPGLTLLRGVIPGYGQYTTWSRWAGAAVAALTVGGGYLANHFVQSANNWYAHYQGNLSGGARYDYALAEQQRGNARAMVAASAALWIASAVEAELQERVHAHRLAVVHEFWFRPVVTPAGPGAGGASAGVAGGIRVPFR